VETGRGNFCLQCFAGPGSDVLDEGYGLPPKPGDKGAERYRWLRAERFDDAVPTVQSKVAGCIGCTLQGDELDAAIDAAMLGSGQRDHGDGRGPAIDPVHEIEKRLEQAERLLRRMENMLAQSGALLGAANEPNPVTEWMAETRAFLGEEETPNTEDQRRP